MKKISLLLAAIFCSGSIAMAAAPAPASPAGAAPKAPKIAMKVVKKKSMKHRTLRRSEAAKPAVAAK